MLDPQSPDATVSPEDPFETTPHAAPEAPSGRRLNTVCSRDSRHTSAERVAGRWQGIDLSAENRDALDDPAFLAALSEKAVLPENYIGTVRVPVGLAGPLLVLGRERVHRVRVPLATTEASLVASYSRGARLISAGGGCRARVLWTGVQRAPVFVFDGLIGAQAFANWLEGEGERLAEVAATTSRFARLSAFRSVVEGNRVFVLLTFNTGDAAGQNMATFAAEAICVAILESTPVSPIDWFLEVNASGDKKATSHTLIEGRGRRVAAEITLPAALVRRYLHTTPEVMARYLAMATIGSALSGGIGVQGHVANGLAALFIATGQDPACVAESAVGITRCETTEGGDLYASVTLPALTVGTVGGGTGLPGPHACLSMLGVAGSGHGEAFAEICAGLCLGGELSLVGALAAGHFARAHRKGARRRK